MDELLIGDADLLVAAVAEPSVAALKAKGDSSNSGANLSDGLDPLLVRAHYMAHLQIIHISTSHNIT